MKKTLSTILLASTLYSLNASAVRIGNSDMQWLSIAGSAAGTVVGISTGAGFAAGAGAAAVTTTIVVLIADQGRYYEGLQNDSIEVLAGQAELEDQPALSLLKEDLLADQDLVEAEVLEATGESIDLASFSDKEFAILGLQVSK
ncbi:MAG: hypothetical protein KC478_02065 [Bacteriovoracaceae bacterium]|nr:hypothetical protein [Bacteriovoracaceae bacterium]